MAMTSFHNMVPEPRSNHRNAAFELHFEKTLALDGGTRVESRKADASLKENIH